MRWPRRAARRRQRGTRAAGRRRATRTSAGLREGRAFCFFHFVVVFYLGLIFPSLGERTRRRTARRVGVSDAGGAATLGGGWGRGPPGGAGPFLTGAAPGSPRGVGTKRSSAPARMLSRKESMKRSLQGKGGGWASKHLLVVGAPGGRARRRPGGRAGAKSGRVQRQCHAGEAAGGRQVRPRFAGSSPSPTAAALTG